MPHLGTFKASVDRDAEPIGFDIEVFDTRTNEVLRKESFEAIANPGAGAEFTLGSVLQIVDGKQVVDVMGVLRFFDRVLLGDGAARMRTLLLEEQDVGLSMDTLGDIIGGLMSYYTGRPTEPSRPSSPGRRNTGASSTGSASSTPA